MMETQKTGFLVVWLKLSKNLLKTKESLLSSSFVTQTSTSELLEALNFLILKVIADVLQDGGYSGVKLGRVW